MPTLGMDIDNTVWDSTSFYHEALEEMGYPRPDPSHETHWDWFFDQYPENVVLEMFRRALDPKRLDDRPLFPNVVEALQEIRERGVKLHFITHNAEPDLMRPPLKGWITEHFGGDSGLSVFHFNTPKITKLVRLGAFGMVDDRAEFAVEVAEAGLWSASKIHPSNRGTVVKDPRIFAFDNWKEVPREVGKVLDFKLYAPTVGGRT